MVGKNPVRSSPADSRRRLEGATVKFEGAPVASASLFFHLPHLPHIDLKIGLRHELLRDIFFPAQHG
jgi:hypothetical protein